MRVLTLNVYAPNVQSSELPGGQTTVRYGDAAEDTPDPGSDGSKGIVVSVVQHTNGWEATAERGISSSSELYAVVRHGTTLLTDSFSAACAALPPDSRALDPLAVASHMLFRTVPGDRTYLRTVRRLGHGQRWSLRSKDSEPRIVQQATLDSRSSGHHECALAALDAVLGDSMQRVVDNISRHGWRGANLLSGGVDSTLLQSYAPQLATVHGVTESPEFGIEGHYAAEASALLGAKHQRVDVREADYLINLQSAITALGMPPHHLQTVLLDAAFGANADAFVTAQFADALFGLPPSSHASSVVRLTSRVPASVLAVGRLVPAQIGRKLRTARRTDGSLGLPPADAGSFAQRFAVYADVDAVSALLGRDAVHAAFAARTAYVSRLVPGMPLEEQGIAANLEVGHLVDFFTDDAVSIWRQLAHARGKELFAPFTDLAVIRESLAVRSPDRFVRDGRVKPALKDLLSRRVPKYLVNKPKQASGLPFDRYYASGPLSKLWEQYAIPDFVPTALADRVTADGGSTAWNLVTWAIWNADVLQNPVHEFRVTPRIALRIGGTPREL